MPPEERQVPKARTGLFKRLNNQGVNQGNVAGYLGDPYNYSGVPYSNHGQMVLARRDEILLQEGGGGPRAVEKYMRLFYDSQVLAAWEKLIGEIVQRKWEVHPASDSAIDEEAAEFVRQVLYRMGSNTRQGHGKDLLVSTNTGFDNMIRGLAEALITGLSVGEICWIKQGKYVIPSEIKMRDPRRILFKLNEDGSVAPRLISFNSPVEGFEIPVRSMIIHRHWCYSGFMDPYGTGLGRVLYSLVDFRRTILTFWLAYTDKYTTPTGIGSFPLGTPEEEVNALHRAVETLGQETSVTIPETMKIELLESKGSTDVYEKMVQYIDQQVSYLINGETTAGQETGNVGSFARDQISDSIRMRKAKALSEEIDETLNATLIRWITELNYPKAGTPRIERNFQDLEQKEDPVKVLQVLTQLQALGYKVDDLNWLRDKMEIPSLVEAPQPPAEQPFTEPKTEESMVDSYNGARGVPGGEFDPSIFSFEEHQSETTRDLIAQKIAKNFKGSLDENIGFDRITRSADSGSRLSVDEYTTPGDIFFHIRTLLSQIEQVPLAVSDESALLYEYRRQVTQFQSLFSTDSFSNEDVQNLLDLYYKCYRLNRRVVYQECVVVDPKQMGYWALFAPYYM